jgi:hypothetical protein
VIILNKKEKNILLVRPEGGKKPLPAITFDVAGYFLREEAKTSTKGIVAGASVLLALGLMVDPARAWHSSVHSNINVHTNQGAASTHTNTNAVATHMNSASHVSAVAVNVHSNLNSHASSALIDQHSNISSHTNQGAVSSHSSAGHTNVAGSPNETVTKGSFHNSGGTGKHSAWTAHSNLIESSHVNATGTNTTTSIPALNAHVSVSNHSNTVAAANAHASAAAHTNIAARNEAPTVNSHASRGATNAHNNITAINNHSNYSSGVNHNSHASW